jgi:3-oxoacyl-[acyl-carrier protein] reductase
MAVSRHVIVTGGSRGLGLGFVEALLADGYRVSTCSRSPTEATERHAGHERFFWQEATIGEQQSTHAFLDAALSWAGGDLYGLVNNAGIAGEGVLATFPNVDIDAILTTNLNGAIITARWALRAMLRRSGPGRIVNISSIIGQRGYTGLAAYSASKAGLDGLTRALAREVGRRGITVNSIAPGYLDTEMSSTLGASQRDQIIRRTPAGRLGTVADVVPTLRFLLSDDAAFMTGQVLTVDGGITC